MHKYKLISKKGEGTFSEVIKAQSIKTGKYVAIKCMKNHFDSVDQVNNLREIQALRKLSPHPHVVKLLEVLYDEPTGRLALVFELMDMNLYEMIKGKRTHLPESKIKGYMYQLLKSIDHMHKNGIFHRDIKPENVLLVDDQLKLADLGSCRGIFSKQPFTEYISTRWYRAPECILTDGYYNYKMDLWGVGCVFFEILSLFPLFPGNNELDQINKIHNILGTPPKELLEKFKKFSKHMDFNFPAKEGKGISKYIPHVTPECVDLIEKMLAYNPDDRITAKQALKHPYFRDLVEQDKKLALAANPSPKPGLGSDNNSDTASLANENVSNLSHTISHNVNNINININTNNQGGMGGHGSNAGSNAAGNVNLKISLPKKDGSETHKLPGLKSGHLDMSSKLHSHSDEDEGNMLPPIKGHDAGKLTKPSDMLMKKPGGGSNMMNPVNLMVGSMGPSNMDYSAKPAGYGNFNFVPISKRINEHKRSYVSPYSQKTVLGKR